MNPNDKAELQDFDTLRTTSVTEHDTDVTPPPHTNYEDDALVSSTQEPGHLRKGKRTQGCIEP